MFDHAVPRLEILPVHGIGEIRPGGDLASALINAGVQLRDGDVVVVTSKIVSKAEGRLITVDPAKREQAREQAIDDETVRVVASRGPTRIVQNRQGLILAAAGVDASNVARDELALLPVDPDASAARLRTAVRDRLGIEIGVIISDSLGRPWRRGIVDVAIGAAGITAVHDERGRIDKYGNVLNMTEVGVADEIAAAADLVKGKLTGIPIAIVRGLNPVDDGHGAKNTIRPVQEDMFRLGTAEAIAIGRKDALGWLEAPPALHRDAERLVHGLQPDNPTEAALRQAYLGFLAARPDAMWRSCLPGHLTASAVVFDRSRRAVLLTLHPRVGLWLQVGGHCELGDHTVLDAAAREAREESGIGTLSFDPVPLDIDIHPITCSLGVPTRHFDMRFLAVAPDGAEPVISDESLDLAWFAWDDLPELISPELPSLVERGRRRLGI